MTDGGDVMDVVPEADRARRPQLAHMHASAPVLPGMEIYRVGHIDCTKCGWAPGDVAKELTAVLQNTPRPIQIVFRHPSTEKVEAARKLQEMRKQQNEMRAARREVDRRRLAATSEATFKKYDVDGNGSLDANEIEKMLLDIIVSWSGAGEDSEGTNDEQNVSDFDISQEIKLAYLGAQLIEKKYGTKTAAGSRPNVTKATLDNGALGMRIAAVKVSRDAALRSHDAAAAMEARQQKLNAMAARKSKRLGESGQLLVCQIQNPNDGGAGGGGGGGGGAAIGIKFDMNQKVVAIKPGSQAESVAKLARGDRLLTIGGMSVATLTAHDISGIFKGRKWPGNSWPVKLEFRRHNTWKRNPNTDLPSELDDEMLKMLVQTYDTDGVGSLDPLQFMAMMREVHSMSGEYRGRELVSLDAIAEADFWEKHKEMGTEPDGTEGDFLRMHCQRMVEKHDSSGDGRLDMDELMGWFLKGLQMDAATRAKFQKKSGLLAQTFIDDVAYGLHAEMTSKELKEAREQEEIADAEDAAAEGLDMANLTSKRAVSETEAVGANTNDGETTEIHITEVLEGSQADEQRLKVGYVIQKVAGTSVGGFSYEDVVNLLRETPRPFELTVLRGKQGYPVMDQDQFCEFVAEMAEISHKDVADHQWDTEEEMRVEQFLVEVGRAISSMADIIRGGRNVVIMFAEEGSVGVELSSDGRVTEIVPGGQADMYNGKEGVQGGKLQPGMVLTRCVFF